ncbi:hypothetical protein A1O1_05905 [Capronia coronata CBS 617.96]|uniref:Uncharacterized protein n=1 Tax=Capronia coronata CBS 617.96 TaxID=1182541 RepID=W9Y8H8_9EURO|nr:uncharacterized protein A1O1_05905 [Capronia coronata CBS 617.96]EXJ85541.1 hypothetical protein A1O1_05905 [Capronia coronata CBS 617.96]
MAAIFTFGGGGPGIVTGHQLPFFQSQLANVDTPRLTYPKAHLLSLPREVREKIFGYLGPSASEVAEEPLTSRGAGGIERSLPLVCRQLFHDTANDGTRYVVKVPCNRLEHFVEQSLSESAAYRNMKALTLELPHNSPNQFYRELATFFILAKTTLEEVKIFGVGTDRFGNLTSSLHPCGKVNTSRRAQLGSLPWNGQDYERRIIFINNIQWLEKLKVLVLDNLNMPVTQAQLFKKKPQLERLRVGTDPRMMLHSRYTTAWQGLGMCNLIYPTGQMPPLRELDISMNGALTTWKVIPPVLPTLEILNWTFPDFATQGGVNYLRIGISLLTGLGAARKLRVLRLCIHGAMYEQVNDMASFMYTLRDSIQRVPTLKAIELHVHSKSPWFAPEFIQALPNSVERLFLADHFVHGDIKRLTDLVGDASNTSTEHHYDDWKPVVGDNLGRTDYIQFAPKNLGFVSYEYNHKMGEQFETDVTNFMRLNGRMLDKERNKHLAPLEGRHIPYAKGGKAADPLVTPWFPDFEEMIPRSQAEVEHIGKQLIHPIFYADRHYFGNEAAAEEVFWAEPVAKVAQRLCSSLPVIVDVEKPFSADSHWLSC